MNLKPCVSLAALAMMIASIQPLAAETLPATPAEPAFTKDSGPAGTCDRHDKGSAAWAGCVGAASVAMPDAELFYAGYWLARSGRYEEALGYLSLARDKDERVLTYIGFATRKLGDVEGAMPFYGAALRKNPDYVVARAYLGEAHLARREPAKARAELAEIGRRCGASCPAYVDLEGHISRYEAARRQG
jgi:tetratricopeptide (TPR) repeat protein